MGSILMIWVLLYCIPAGLLGLGAWMLLRLLATLGVGIRWRRMLCFLLIILLFTPVSVPIATIMSGWVPMGGFLVMGELPFLFNARLVAETLVALAVTAVVAAVVTWLLLGRPRARSELHREVPWRASKPWPWQLRKLVLPPLVIVGVFTLFHLVGNRPELPAHIDEGLMERLYGARLHALHVTGALVDRDQGRARLEALGGLFAADDLVIGLSVHDERIDPRSIELVRPPLRPDGSTSRRCSGSYELMRCTRNGGPIFGGLATLSYRSRLRAGEVSSHVELELDYDALINRFPDQASVDALGRQAPPGVPRATDGRVPHAP